MKKDNLASLHDEGSKPDVEIPGTRLGLKTVVDLTRAVFGIYPKYIGGDIVVPVDIPADAGSRLTKRQATVTVYVTQGHNPGEAVSVVVAADDIGMLVQRTAEAVLEQVNPYVLAAYREEHRDYENAVEIVERMIQNPSEDRSHKEAAFNLWGNALWHQKKYGEAIARFQKAIDLDPKDALAYNNWGNVLWDQKKYDQAIAKYQKAIDLNPKFAYPYINWGLLLQDQKKYGEAIARFQKAIDLDPKFALPYNDWGNVLLNQKKYDQAIAKYQKAIDLDPKFAAPYYNWGLVLRDQEKYDEAAVKFDRADELSRSQ